MPDCLVPVRSAQPAPPSSVQIPDWNSIIAFIREQAALEKGGEREALIQWAGLMQGAAMLSPDQD